MKKSLQTVLVSALLAIAAFSAQAVEVTTNVGATSNYVDRGVSLSGRDLSATAGVKAVYANGVFGSAQASTVRIGGANLETIATVGYGQTVGGVDLVGGYTHRFYTGSSIASDRNFGEVFGKATYKGASALVAQTVTPTSFSGNNTFVRVGYYTRYSRDDVTRHTATDVTVSYQALANTKVFAGYSQGGRGEFGNRLANQAFVGASVAF
jgi:uncharacterized protein (TIGR02001 family)